VGTSGAVLGVDIAEGLLDLARERAAEMGVAIEYVCADAQTYTITGGYDAVFSRFGVKFSLSLLRPSPT